MQPLRGGSLSPDPSGMGVAGVAVQQYPSNKLGLQSFRGITLKQLDRYLQGHDDAALAAYLAWLQEQMDDWDLSDSKILQAKIQSWCDRLRNHNLLPHHIFQSFRNWTRNQAEIAASDPRRMLVIEEELRSNLFRPRSQKQPVPRPGPHRLPITVNSSHDSPSYKKPDTLDSLSDRPNSVIMEKGDVIEVSSSSDDSSVEFLGWTVPNRKHDETDRDDKTKALPYRPAAHKENGLSIGIYDGINNEMPVKATKERKHGNSQIYGKQRDRQYVCNRCNVPGHLLKYCPTNFDPSYDQKPGNDYTCKICGAKNDHFLPLCPKNTDPRSLTQLRIKGRRNDELFGNMDVGYGKHREMKEVHHDNDNWSEKEPRDVSGKRSDSRQQSTEKHGRLSGRDNSYCSSPPHKRARRGKRGPNNGRGRSHDYERGWDRRRDDDRWIRFLSPSKSAEDSSIHGGPSELLPFASYRADDEDGRLSYWDDDSSSFNKPRVLSEGSTSPGRLLEPEEPQHELPVTVFPASVETRRLSAAEAWSEEQNEKKKEIKERFPEADLGWVDSILRFDVDKFLDQMSPWTDVQLNDLGKQDIGLGEEAIMGNLEFGRHSHSANKTQVEEDRHNPHADNTRTEINEAQC